MRSLRARLILSHIFPILVIIPVVGAVLVYLLETQFLISNTSNELVRQAGLVADVAGAYWEIWFDAGRAQNFVNQISPSIPAKIMLLDPTGRLIVSSDSTDAKQAGQFFSQPAIDNILHNQQPADVSYQDGQISEVVVPVVTSDLRLLGFVRLVNPFADIYSRSQNLRSLTLGVLGGGLVLGIVLALLLATDLERPLRRVTQAVIQVSERRQLTPLKEEGPREVRLLVRSVNSMVERLETLEESRRRLLANLVHEIGTPLGSLRSGAQALLSGADEDPSLRKELLIGIDDELDRLQNLLDELAHLHDQILGTLELNLRSVPLGEWLPRAVLPWKKAAEEKKIAWDEAIPSDLPTVDIDPDRLAQAVSNLLSNAIRYTPPDGQISIRANVNSGDLEISIQDTGPGIRLEEQKQIFTPFYRGKAAHRFSSGMGLGLSISKDIVEAHGGQLSLASQPGEGSCFTIRIPVNSSPNKETT